MRPAPAGLALLVVGLLALADATEAQALGHRLHSRGCPPAPCSAAELVPVPAPAPPAPNRSLYQLWIYKGAGMGWQKRGNPHPSHTHLHGQGKGLARRHVHPKYWNENRFVAPNARLLDTNLFTVTRAGASPNPNPTPTLPTFCLYHCRDHWTYKTQGTDYQALYEDPMNSGLEGRECSEACEGFTGVVMYFTVCADGDSMYGGGTCCITITKEPFPLYAPCLPCEPPAPRCLIGRLLHARRSGCGPCR